MTSPSVDKIESALLNSWSAQSSSKWTASNPALGQCGVTALVVQNHLGGEIYKTLIKKPGKPPLWHFYNHVNGEFVDFTASQFDELVPYDNLASGRKEAFEDTNNEQYTYLSKAVNSYLNLA